MSFSVVLLFCLLPLGIFCSNGSVSDQNRILVLVDSLSVKETHSIYFKSLHGKGFQLTFKVADDPSIVLKKYGAYLYEHLILFCPSVEEFGGTLSIQGITEFVDNGGNVLVAGSHQTGDVLRDLATEFGFEADEENRAVIDHVNFDVNKDDGKHTTVIADEKNLINSEYVVGKKTGSPILYKGTGLITDQDNPLVLEVLTASSTAYSYNPDQPVTEYPHAIGKSMVLIAGLQARNSARVVFSGSLDFFSDEFFEATIQCFAQSGMKTSGNRALAMAISSWTFKKVGVLRVVGVNHHLVGEKAPPAGGTYTIAEDVVYSIDIEELQEGKWIPYKATDVQMEFVRIDPFVRLTLKNGKTKGRFEGQFKIPDVYGVYQFKVNYVRTGLTRLDSTTQFSVRPLRHDQYERFISSAYPYYASAFSMMFGVFIFSFVFLHYRDDAKSKTE